MCYCFVLYWHTLWRKHLCLLTYFERTVQWGQDSNLWHISGTLERAKYELFSCVLQIFNCQILWKMLKWITQILWWREKCRLATMNHYKFQNEPWLLSQWVWTLACHEEFDLGMLSHKKCTAEIPLMNYRFILSSFPPPPPRVHRERQALLWQSSSHLM